MAKIVIFGNKEIAELANFYFSHDTAHEVVAFTADGEYVKENSFQGLPVVAFEEIENRFSPANHLMFVALSYAQLNLLRKTKYLAAKAKGYQLASYVCSKAHWWNENKIGDNCFILEDVIIQPFVEIGNNVFIWSGNHIGHHTLIKDHAFITSHVVMGGGVVIGEQCFVGINATIRDHISIGERCIIGAAACIMSDTEPDGLYLGAASPRAKTPSSKIKL